MILVPIGGLLFLLSAAAHIYVRVRAKRWYDEDLDDYYHEVEDRHPGLARYERWVQVTLGGVVIGALLLLLAIVL